MCGIVGYVGPRPAAHILLEGLRRLEYRGYDSAGVAVINGNGVKVRKAAGKLAVLRDQLKDDAPEGTVGIGHTRWATHGAPTTPNAHPHLDGSGKIALIHNGIIENASTIKTLLVQRGHKFTSETDTEVLAHLVGEYYRGSLEEAVASALRDVQGAYGIAVISADEPDVLVAARNGSPLLVGVGEKEWFVASDASAILEHTRSVVYLDDGEMVVLTRSRLPGAEPVQGKDRQAGRPDRLGSRHDRTGRVFPLHAQGDLRAAGERRQHAARPPARGGRQLPGSRPQPGRRPDQELQPRRDHRLRHLLALRPHRRVHDRGDRPAAGGSRIRLGIPLPEPGAGRADAGDRDLPVGRDGRHPGRGARSQAARRPRRGPGERRGQHHRARSERRPLPARGPRGRRREHQGVLEPGRRARAGGAPDRAAPEPEHHPGPRVRAGAAAAPREDPAGARSRE